MKLTKPSRDEWDFNELLGYAVIGASIAAFASAGFKKDLPVERLTTLGYITLYGVSIGAGWLMRSHYDRRIRWLKYEVQELQRRAGTDPLKEAPPGVVEALRAGNLKQAERLHRRATVAGMYEARAEVKELAELLRTSDKSMKG